MAELKALLEKTPVVIILDNLDPFCSEIVKIVKEFKIDETKITFFYTDKEPNGKKVLEQTEHKAAPMMYISGEYYFGGQELKEFSSTVKLRRDLVKAGALELKLDKAKTLINSAKCVVFTNKFSPFADEAKLILLKYMEITNPNLKFVFTDKLTDGVDIDHAVLYISEVSETPVFFFDGEPAGGYEWLKKMHDDFAMWDFLSEKKCIPPLPHTQLKQLKEEYGILIVGNDYSTYSFDIKAVFNNVQLEEGVLRIECEGTPENKALELAAMVDTKSREGPYIYVAEKHVDFKRFLGKAPNEVLAILKELGL